MQECDSFNFREKIEEANAKIQALTQSATAN